MLSRHETRWRKARLRLQEVDEKLRTRRGPSSSIMLLLLTRGEFGVLNIIMLLSIYGAAILAIPLILGSFFEVSTTFLQFPNQSTFAALLLSIYAHAQSSYNLVLLSLFLGFGITSFVSGISIGRKMKTVDKEFSVLGMPGSERKLSRGVAFLLISVSCLALGFAFAFFFSSVALYSVSLLVHGPYLTPATTLSFWIYLALIPIIEFLALITGSNSIKS